MEAVQTITIRVFIIVLSVVLIGMLLGTISKAFIFNTDNSYGAVAKRIGQKISYVASTDSDYSGDWIELPHADFGVAITKDGVKIKSSEGTEIIKPLHYTGDLVIQEFPKEGGFEDFEKDEPKVLCVMRTKTDICFFVEDLTENQCIDRECEVTVDSEPEGPDIPAEPVDPVAIPPVPADCGFLCGFPTQFCCEEDASFSCQGSACSGFEYTWTGADPFLYIFIGDAWKQWNTIYNLPVGVEIKLVPSKSGELRGVLLEAGGYTLDGDDADTDVDLMYYCPTNPLLKFVVDGTDTIGKMPSGDFAVFNDATKYFGVYKCNLVVNQDSINYVVGKEAPFDITGGDIKIEVG